MFICKISSPISEFTAERLYILLHNFFLHASYKGENIKAMMLTDDSIK